MTELAASAAAVLAATPALVAIVDAAGLLVDVNPALLAATGRSRDELLGADGAAALAVPKEATELRRVLRAVVIAGEPHAQEHQLPTGDGRTCIAWTVARLDGASRTVVCVGVDVSAAREHADDLLLRTMTDELTGLPNRVHLVEHLRRMSGSGASVLFCDLNGFKAVNDSFGHAVGDATLVEVGRRLLLAVRGEDFVARLGGDEFVIVAPPSPTASADGLARRILNTMRQPMLLGGGVVVVVGVSIGASDLQAGQDADAVLHEADARMYVAKSLRPSGGAVRS